MSLISPGLTLPNYNQSDFIEGKTVANYSALPPAADNDGLLAICVASQGVWLVNYKAAGIYYSDGASWIYQGDYELTDVASEIGFTPAGGVVATNVQAAIVEVAGMSGGTAWGDITGTLSAQTDLQSALDGKVDENVAITGATKTKITYDAKGLVTAGADATTADIADSLNKRYISDAEQVILGNTSGVNTGNETASTLGATINATASVTINNTDLVTTVASSIVKAVTWADVKTFLKTYFDGLYPSGSGTSTGTNTGDQTSIVGISSTKAQFDTACNDGNFLYVGDVVGLTDGDKGDITVSASGATWTIDNNVVTNAKLDDMAGYTVKVRSAGSSGDPSDLAMGSHSALVRNGGDIVAADAAVNTVLCRASGNTLQFDKVTASMTAITGTPTGSKFLRDDWSWQTIAGGGDVVGPASATDNAIARYDLTTGKLLQNSGVTISDNGEILCAAGGTADAPIKFQSGTNLTTAEAGAMEFDGSVFYATAIAAARQVNVATQFAIVPTGGFALSTAAGVQSCFPAATDVWTLAGSTTYRFEGMYYITKSTNSVTTALAFALGGGASVTSIGYQVLSHAAAVNVTATANNSTWVTRETSTVVTIATTAATLIQFRGLIRMNAGGTVTPQINFSGTAAGSPTMAANSYIMFTPIGSNTVASVGNVA